MSDHISNRATRRTFPQERRVVHDAHDATTYRDGAQLVVAEIAPMGVRTADTRVRYDWRQVATVYI